MGSHLIQESMQEDINDPWLLIKQKQGNGTAAPDHTARFLNRIDEIIMFHALTPENVREILKMQVDKISEMLRTKGIRMELTEKALDYLQIKGYEPSYGARPLKRLLQRELVNELARKILEGTLDVNGTILADSDGSGLDLRES